MVHLIVVPHDRRYQIDICQSAAANPMNAVVLGLLLASFQTNQSSSAGRDGDHGGAPSPACEKALDGRSGISPLTDCPDDE